MNNQKSFTNFKYDYFCDKSYRFSTYFPCLIASLSSMLYLQLCEDEPDDVPIDGRRKRDVRSINQDTDNVYSYGPIYVHSNKPSCLLVLVRHSALDLRVVQERSFFGNSFVE